jgi:hypothetical protein
MNDPGKTLPKHKLIKLFLSPDEVSVLVSSLNWLKEDLTNVIENLQKLNTPEVEPIASNIRSDFFTVFTSFIDRTIEHILTESSAKFNERGDNKGKENLKEVLDRIHERTQELRQYEQIVTTGINIQNMTKGIRGVVSIKADPSP